MCMRTARLLARRVCTLPPPSRAGAAHVVLTLTLILTQTLTRAQVPPEWFCPLSRMLMLDPVCLMDGVSYNKAALEEWLQTKGSINPATGAPLEEPVPRSLRAHALRLWLHAFTPHAHALHAHAHTARRTRARATPSSPRHPPQPSPWTGAAHPQLAAAQADPRAARGAPAAAAARRHPARHGARRPWWPRRARRPRHRPLAFSLSGARAPPPPAAAAPERYIFGSPRAHLMTSLCRCRCRSPRPTPEAELRRVRVRAERGPRRERRLLDVE